MLEYLLGSKSKERILIFITARKEGYGREIARFYDTDLTPIQKQLDKLEEGNILYSKLIGKTRVYAFNPRYAFINELQQLINKTIDFLPEEEKEKLIKIRKRPRRKGKPI